MQRSVSWWCGRGLVAAFVVAIALAGLQALAQNSAGQSSTGQANAAVQQAAPSSPEAPKAARQAGDVNEFRPRLPMYYARVVTEEQRQKIYAIQREYYPKIAALRKQLEDLIAEQNAKIEAVLTPEQKSELDKIRAEAAAKRKSSGTESPQTTQETN
ncbi:MAG: hypothetical protein ACUVQG_13450 [Thermogutta sp.]